MTDPIIVEYLRECTRKARNKGRISEGYYNLVNDACTELEAHREIHGRANNGVAKLKNLMSIRHAERWGLVQTFIKVGGTTFHCIGCGSNQFQANDKDPNTFRCCGCNATYRGEAE